MATTNVISASIETDIVSFRLVIRRFFQEHCVCFVLDVSTMSQTQFDLYREALCEIIRDQVSQLAKFNIIK